MTRQYIVTPSDSSIMLSITIKTLQLGDFQLQVPAESSVSALKVQVKVLEVEKVVCLGRRGWIGTTSRCDRAMLCNTIFLVPRPSFTC